MQPKVDNYKIVCRNCDGVSRLAIMNDSTVMYKDQTPIISSRLRPDMKWGFECQCGNDSRVAPEEKNNLDTLVKGGQHSIDRIAKELKPKNETKFKMVAA